MKGRVYCIVLLFLLFPAFFLAAEGYSNYTPRPLKYRGETYRGTTAVIDPNKPRSLDDKIVMDYPLSRHIEVDGFVRVKGHNMYDGDLQYCLIRVRKNDASGNCHEIYWGRKDFDLRVWLRYGPGDYTITVERGRVTNNLNYDGQACFHGTFRQVYRFTATQTRDDGDERYFYPWRTFQADDEKFLQLSHAIVDGYDTDREKMKAIHDWVAAYLTYDFDSLKEGKRKKMDALSALSNRIAVCDGYTNLTTALLLAAGFKARQAHTILPRGRHSWVEVLHEGEWKLIDVTYDDANDILRHAYFLAPQEGIDGDHLPEKYRITYIGSKDANHRF